MNRKILLVVVLLFCSCSPLKRTQQSEKVDSMVVDRTEIHKIVTDIIKEQGVLKQTVVEYYPPATSSPIPGEGTICNSAPIVYTAIKRIVKMEIATNTEKTTTTDSLAKNDITTTVKSEYSDKVVEKPSSLVTTVKWIAIGLGVFLVLFVVMKFRK